MHGISQLFALLILSIGVRVSTQSNLAHGAELTVASDPTYEVMSILAYLAGYEEFQEKHNKAYAASVEAHFRPFANHRAVRLTAKLRRKCGIGYNAMSDLAAHVNADFTLRMPLDPLPTGLDDRWSDPKWTNRFLHAAAQFAEDTNFAEFWASQSTYVSAVEQRFRDSFAERDIIGWYEQQLGPSEGSTYRIVPGLLNNGNNYGTILANSDGSVVYRPAIGVWHLDEQGLPGLDTDVELIVVHEIGHGFGNPFVHANEATLIEIATKLYEINAPLMDDQAYGDPMIVMGETLTRAFTVLYASDRFGPDLREEESKWNNKVGFLWIEPLVDVLEKRRDEGIIDLSAMMPEAAAAMESWLENTKPTPPSDTPASTENE